MKRIQTFLMTAILLLSAGMAAYADEPRVEVDAGGHAGIIRRIIFTPDKKNLVSVGDDKVIRIWDVKTGDLVRTIRGQVGDGVEGSIYAMALSPDGKYLAVGGYMDKAPDGTPLPATNETIARFKRIGRIRIHDFQTGEVVKVLEGCLGVVDDMTFSPDGRYLAVGNLSRVWLWDVQTWNGIQLGEHSAGRVYALAFSKDGKSLVSGSGNGSMKLWDVERHLFVGDMVGHAKAVRSIVFSPDGRFIVSGGDDGKILRWDGKTGMPLNTLWHQAGSAWSLAVDNKGELLSGWTSKTPNNVVIYSLNNQVEATPFTQHNGMVLATAISQDGTVAATAGGYDNTIYVWEPQTRRILHKLPGQGESVRKVGFANDGHSIAFGNSTKLEHVFLLSEGERVFLGEDVTDEASYDGTITSAGDYQLKTTDGDGPQSVLQVLKGDQIISKIPRGEATGYKHIAYTFTTDGKHVISGGSNGVLAIYDAQTGKLEHEFVGHTGAVNSVAVSPDNRLLVSGSDDQTIRLWDINSKQYLLSIFVGPDREWVAWTPQGYYTSSVHGDKYFGWHLNQGFDKPAAYYTADQFQKVLYRPGVIWEYLRTGGGDITKAIEQDDIRHGRKVGDGRQVLTTSTIPTALPPVIDVSSPKAKELSVKDEVYTVSGVVRSDTLPIKQVKVYQNNVEVESLEYNPQEPLRRDLDVQVTLQPGPNEIVVTADSEVASAERVVRTIFYQKKSEKPNLVLLAIGISDYKQRKLNYAHLDAESFGETFEKQKGLQDMYGNINPHVLITPPPGHDAIIQGLKWLDDATQNLSPKDVVIVFFSGHGATDKRGDLYFLSADHDEGADLDLRDIPSTILLRRLDAIPAQVILFLDSCHAAKAGEKPLMNFTEAVKQLNREYPRLAIFAASSGDESAQESELYKHGIFTKALIDGLAGQADQEEPVSVDEISGLVHKEKDGFITIRELGAWLEDDVPLLTHKSQHPKYIPPISETNLRIFSLK